MYCFPCVCPGVAVRDKRAVVHRDLRGLVPLNFGLGPIGAVPVVAGRPVGGVQDGTGEVVGEHGLPVAAGAVGAGSAEGPVVPGWATATPLDAPEPVLKAAKAPNSERATTAEASARRRGFCFIARVPAVGRHRQPPIWRTRHTLVRSSSRSRAIGAPLPWSQSLTVPVVVNSRTVSRASENGSSASRAEGVAHRAGRGIAGRSHLLANGCPVGAVRIGVAVDGMAQQVLEDHLGSSDLVESHGPRGHVDMVVVVGVGTDLHPQGLEWGELFGLQHGGARHPDRGRSDEGTGGHIERRHHSPRRHLLGGTDEIGVAVVEGHHDRTLGELLVAGDGGGEIRHGERGAP